MAQTRTYAAEVAEKIIEQLKQGTAPWVKPWAPGERVMPFNPVTEKDYRGMNVVVLLMAAHDKGFDDPRWMTLKQANSIDGRIQKGQKGTRLQFFKTHEDVVVLDAGGDPLLDEDGKPETVRVQLDRPIVYPFTVFNAQQIDGLPELVARPSLPEWERHQLAEAILVNSRAHISHRPGDLAAYAPGLDLIILPERSQFATADGFYSVALHELGHWTGHSTRLDRDLAHPFGSEGYAREELRAEIASLMIGDRLSIGHDPGQHVAYIDTWIRILQQDPQELQRAARDAERIDSFLRSFVEVQTVEMPQEPTVSPVKVPEQPIEQPVLTTERIDLYVPFKEHKIAKELGARYDYDGKPKTWYLPAGVDPRPFERWRTPPAPRERPKTDAEILAEFKHFLTAELGLVIKGELVSGGLMQRVPVEGAARGKKDGAYFAHLDGVPTVWGRNYFTGITKTWTIHRPVPKLSEAERQKLEAERQEKIQRREDEYNAAARVTTEAIEAHLKANPQITAETPDYAEHAYLRKKGVGAHGIFYIKTEPLTFQRIGETKPSKWGKQGDLVIPIRDVDGKLLGGQAINAAGMKSLSANSRISGGHHLLGEIDPKKQLVIAEGYATAATLYEAMAMRVPVAVAFSGSNLEAVARAFRERYRDLSIIVAGDNDHAKELLSPPKPNEGKVKAEAAAAAVGGAVMLPTFEPSNQSSGENDRAASKKRHGSDWNDLAAQDREEGKDFVERLRGSFRDANRAAQHALKVVQIQQSRQAQNTQDATSQQERTVRRARSA